MRSAGVALALMSLCAAAMSVPAAAEVRFGVGAPLSGPDAIFGDQIKLGVEQAVADVNGAGGLLGQRARVLLGDDGDDPTKAANVARHFVSEHVPFVVGHFSSAATVPASAIYADAGAIGITPSAEAPIVTDRGLPTVFRTCSRDDAQAEVAARFLLQRHLTRVALVHDRSTDGKKLVDSLRRQLAKSGVQDVLYNSVDRGTRDFGDLVARLRTSNAQVVFFGGAPTEAGLLARQLRDANVHITLMGGDSLAADDFPLHAGNAADGSLIVFPQDPRSRPAAAALLRRLRERGIDPAAYVFYSYAAVQVVTEAAKTAGSLDPGRIAAEMHSGHAFDTVLGTLHFDAKGDPTVTDFAVFVWHKGATGHMTFDDQART